MGHQGNSKGVKQGIGPGGTDREGSRTRGRVTMIGREGTGTTGREFHKGQLWEVGTIQGQTNFGETQGCTGTNYYNNLTMNLIK